MTHAPNHEPKTAPLFHYTEECDLALMQHKHTGKKLYLEKSDWTDIVVSLKSGWTPKR